MPDFTVSFTGTQRNALTQSSRFAWIDPFKVYAGLQQEWQTQRIVSTPTREHVDMVLPCLPAYACGAGWSCTELEKHKRDFYHGFQQVKDVLVFFKKASKSVLENVMCLCAYLWPCYN